MCLTIVVTLLDSTIEIKLVLYSHYTVGAPVWSAKASMYLRTTLVFFTAFYMHIISPLVESDYISG